ncbi:MAG TPA: hypothetical protein VHR18_06335 [Solirubrobacterales bacterium]|jgi:hypothetical protein|nr:hypothetical protein [Solirubrobacterales bacterium]
MDESRKAAQREQAKARLEIQRARVRQLRRRCIAVSVVCFALLWGVVFTQLVSGNDPVLARKTESKSQSSTGTATVIPGAAEQLEIEAAESEAIELEAAEVEASELEAAEAEAEELTTSPS